MPAPIRRTDEHGFAIPTNTFDELMPPSPPAAQAGDPPTANAAGGAVWKWRWWVLMLLVGVMFGGVMIQFGRHFVAQWFVSRAERYYDINNLQAALVDLDRAIDWEPDPAHDWKAYYVRAIIRDEQQNLPDSLDDFNQVISALADPAQSPDDEASVCLGKSYRRRSWILARLGRNAEAIEDATKAVELAADDQEEEQTTLNHRAYVRALAGVELEQGLQDIERALAGNPHEPAFIDTRGYLLFRLGRYDAALIDLNNAIDATDQRRQMFAPNWDQRIVGQRHRAFVDPSDSLRRLDEDLAVMYHHRGEVYEKLGQHDKAKADMSRAERLGFNRAKGVF